MRFDRACIRDEKDITADIQKSQCGSSGYKRVYFTSFQKVSVNDVLFFFFSCQISFSNPHVFMSHRKDNIFIITIIISSHNVACLRNDESGRRADQFFFHPEVGFLCKKRALWLCKTI